MTHVEVSYKGVENPSEAELHIHHLLTALTGGFSNNTFDNEIKKTPQANEAIKN